MSAINTSYTSLATDYLSLATGNKLNSAANNPSGMAIAEQMTSQINGYEQGTENTQDMSNLVSTAEGALSTISDQLQRVRELALQSMNGIYSDSDKAILDFEVQQIMEGIGQTVSSTQYNGQNLLDGSFVNKNTASSPDGTGMQVSIPNMSLEALNLDNFSISGDFSLDDLDAAIKTVSDARSQLGSTTNRMSYTINSNQVSELNLASARSGYTDTDMARTASELKKKTLMNDIQLMMQKNQQENEKQKVAFLL